MNSSVKFPDRLNITKKAKIVVDNIDQNKYLSLDSPNTSRSDLFTLAMSFGIDTVPTKLENIYPGGLILDSSINSRTKALMYAYFIGKLSNVDMLDSVTNKEYVYNTAQEYANTSFEILEDYLQNKKDSDLIWDLILELDELYNKNVR